MKHLLIPHRFIALSLLLALRLNQALVRAGLTSFSPQPPDVYGAEHEFAVKLMT